MPETVGTLQNMFEVAMRDSLRNVACQGCSAANAEAATRMAAHDIKVAFILSSNDATTRWRVKTTENIS
jgi:hypothetical protein